MTTADEFRATATQIRQTAAHTTPGEWGLVESGELVAWSDNEAQTPEYLSHHLDWSNGNDLQWAALMHPGTGSALADLFEVAANFVEEYPDLGREHVDGEQCDDYACGLVTKLQSVARAVNGGA